MNPLHVPSSNWQPPGSLNRAYTDPQSIPAVGRATRTGGPQRDRGRPGRSHSQTPRQGRLIVTFCRVHRCVVEQRRYTPGCTCKTRTATCEGRRWRETPGLHHDPESPAKAKEEVPLQKRARSKGSLHLLSRRRAGPQQIPPEKSSTERRRGAQQSVKSRGPAGTPSVPALAGHQLAGLPQDKARCAPRPAPRGRRNHTALRCTPAEDGTCPTLPSSPRSPGAAARRQKHRAPRHHRPRTHRAGSWSALGATNPRGRGRSPLVCRRLPSAGIRPRGAGSWPLTCVEPRTPGSSSGRAQEQAEARAALHPARHR